MLSAMNPVDDLELRVHQDAGLEVDLAFRRYSTEQTAEARECFLRTLRDFADLLRTSDFC